MPKGSPQGKDQDFVSRAVRIAAHAHEDQKDKGGEPYILHPMWVMLKMKTNSQRTVAALHDVVEDTDMSLRDLRHMGFPLFIVDAVDAITQRKGEETYKEYIHRLKDNELAREVKIADLEHNMDTTRRPKIKGLSSLMKRYQWAWGFLMGVDEIEIKASKSEKAYAD